MSLGVTKECFPPATKCHNCQRKRREDILENPEGQKEFKRCTRCHLLTYCDKDCQREHWEVVHKRHCGFLSGQKLVKNSQHRKANCSLCIEERKCRAREVMSTTSPKSACYLESMIYGLKISIGENFDFHAEGKECNCSLNIACELPLALGELSGQFVGNGLDEMIAHTMKIANAMRLKGENASNVANQNRTLTQLWMYLVVFRATVWYIIVIYGAPRYHDDTILSKYLSKPVEKLQLLYGANNPWWKALYYSVSLIANINDLLLSQFYVKTTLDDKRFGILKQILNYEHSQSRNLELVTQKNLWPRFKLWPVQVNGELILLLPDGTHCQVCEAPLTGQFSVIGNIATSTDISPPMLIPRFGENGQLVVSCSAAQKPRCREEMIKNDLIHSLGVNEGQWRKYLEEQKAFKVMSRFCDFCLKQSMSSHRCSACKAAQYCSTQCQYEDLSFHKSVCSAWAQDERRKIGGAKYQKKSYKAEVDQEMKRVDEVLKEHFKSLKDYGLKY